jgi:hypothetical protein
LNCTKLTSLTLTNAQLKELPEEIGNLQQLENLDISYNPLNSLPKAMGKLTNLKTLKMSTYSSSEGLLESFAFLPKGCTVYIQTYETLLPERIALQKKLKEQNIHVIFTDLYGKVLTPETKALSLIPQTENPPKSSHNDVLRDLFNHVEEQIISTIQAENKLAFENKVKKANAKHTDEEALLRKWKEEFGRLQEVKSPEKFETAREELLKQIQNYMGTMRVLDLDGPIAQLEEEIKKLEYKAS